MTSSPGPSIPPPYAGQYPAPAPYPAPPGWAPPTGPVSFADPAGAGPSGVSGPGGPPPRRRRGLRTALVAVPALLVVAGASSLITVLVAGGGHGTTHGTGTAAGKDGASARHATVGTLTSQDGSTWTVRTTAGKTVTVDLGARTTYGTKAHPTQQSAFQPGSDVRVVGADKGSTVDARRVVLVTTTGSTGKTT